MLRHGCCHVLVPVDSATCICDLLVLEADDLELYAVQSGDKQGLAGCLDTCNRADSSHHT